MAISKVDWALQFARLNAAPIDASQTIDTLANLRAALNAAKSKYYAGQLVSVTDDGDNNGAYRVTGATGSLSVTRLDLPPIVQGMEQKERFPGEFDWGYLWRENGSITLSLSAPQGTKAYIGVISDYVEAQIDIVRSSDNPSLQATTTVKNRVHIVGEITIAEEGEGFEVTHLTDEVNTVVFITTNKSYFDNLCNVSEFYSGVSEAGFDSDYGVSVDQYIHAQLGARVFYGEAFGVNLFDSASLIVFTGNISEYTHAQFYDIAEDFFVIPLSSSTGDSGGSVGSAFNFVGSITSFPTSYATGDMWFLDPDGEEMTKPSNITLVGFKKLSAQDFLLCLDAETNKFTVLQSNLSVDLNDYAKASDVPAASDDDPAGIDGELSSGTSSNYARADHKHTINLAADCGVDSAESDWSNNELKIQTKHVFVPFGWNGKTENGTTYTEGSSAENLADIQLNLNRSADPYNTNYHGMDFRFFSDNVESLLTRCVDGEDAYTCGLVRYNDRQCFAIQKAAKIYLYDMCTFKEEWLDNDLFSKAVLNLPPGTNAFSEDGLTKYTCIGDGDFQKETYVLLRLNNTEEG